MQPGKASSTLPATACLRGDRLSCELDREAFPVGQKFPQQIIQDLARSNSD